MKRFFKNFALILLCVALTSCSAIASRSHNPLRNQDGEKIIQPKEKKPLVYYKGTKWNWNMMRDIYGGRYSIPAAIYGHVVYIIDTPFSLVVDTVFFPTEWLGNRGRLEALEKVEEEESENAIE